MANFGLQLEAVAEDVGSKKINTYIIKAKILSKLVNSILDLKVPVHYFMLNLT